MHICMNWQSVTFDFPYRYDYSAAFTCEADTVPTIAMLKRVQEHCPASLLAAKVIPRCDTVGPVQVPTVHLREWSAAVQVRAPRKI